MRVTYARIVNCHRERYNRMKGFKSLAWHVFLERHSKSYDNSANIERGGDVLGHVAEGVVFAARR